MPGGTQEKQPTPDRGEGAKRKPGERWPADPWGDDPYWIEPKSEKPQ